MAEARDEVDRFLVELGWDVAADSPGRHELAVALATLRPLSWPNATPQLFERYAKAADRLAALEVRRTTPADATRAEIMERVVIGTVVFDAVLSALRRLPRSVTRRCGSVRPPSRRAGSVTWIKRLCTRLCTVAGRPPILDLSAEGDGELGKLIYLMTASLDGHIADADGNFDWTEPDEEVHTFVIDLERSVGTFLFGRRLYEVMTVWETLEDESPFMRDFASIWRSADKVVYSTSLESVSTARTRLERAFEPRAVEQLKTASDRDLSIGGPGLATSAIRAGLIDEWHLFLTPVVVGGGTAYFPEGVREELDLLEERRFASGTMYLRYRTRGHSRPQDRWS